MTDASDALPSLDAFPASAVPLLGEWMPEQRWFGGKGSTPALRLVGSYDLTPYGVDVDAYRAEILRGSASVAILTALMLDEGGARPVLYQVPLTIRDEPQGERAAIGRLDSGAYLYDGTHDVEYAAALLALITRDESAGNARGGAGVGATAVSGHSQEPGHPLVVVDARVLSGEQSNTSIIMTVTDPKGDEQPPVICKVFRVLHHGDNPDVVLQSAIAKAGSTRVPRSVGSVAGSWADPRMVGGRASGHLAFAQEFLPGVRDAWRIALDAVDEGRPFVSEAHALGAATADVHQTLAAAFPTASPTPSAVAEILVSMRERRTAAVLEVPELARHTAAIDAIFERAANGAWPPLQRVHGDYHLGQVLAVPGGRWMLVDFEGEPLRPMSERSQLDLALRDIAGMLRSFDYVAGSFAASHPGQNAALWAADARRAFLEGYASHAGGQDGLDLAPYRALLRALELDKALYETVYEARNRPSWVGIPLAAIDRLVLSP